MPYLDQTGLSVFWDKVKNWTRSRHGASISKGTATQGGIPLNLMNGADTPVALGATVTITKEDIAATGAKVTDTVYAHPAGGAPSKAAGLYKFSTDATSHVASVAAVTKSDITALGIPAQDTTYKEATQAAAGLMGAADKKKLDGVEAGANKYVHPASAAGAKASGLYKVATDAQGHVTAAVAVAKADITALGIPGSQPAVPAWTADPKGSDIVVDGGDLDGMTVSEGLQELSDSVAGKQDAISDLATIRAGAAKGATAVQKETDPTVPAWAKAASKPSYSDAEIRITKTPAGFSVSDGLDDILSGLASGKAPIASPALTGTPTAPTAAAGTSTTQIATCAFVASALASAMTGAAKYKGGITPDAYSKLTSYTQGWYWVVTAAGTIAGEACEVGDMVFCNASNSGASTKKDSHFDVVQDNITAIPASAIDALA